MQPAETPEANSPAGVAPTPRPSTAWRVVSVEPLPGMCLRVKFIDGTSGEVRLQRFLESPQVNGTVFEPLRDPDRFAEVIVDPEGGTVAWPSTGADLDPVVLYDCTPR